MQTLVDRHSLWIWGNWSEVQQRLQSLIALYGQETPLADVLRLLQQ